MPRMQPTTMTALKPHKCFVEADKALAEHNTAIDFAFSITDSAARPQIRTYKVDTAKRGQPKKLLATYCPFCGSALNRAIK